MGTAPTPILVSSQGVGNSADGTITRDAIDDLIGAMSSKLLIYLRAKKIDVTKTGIVDALGNNVTAVATATKNNADANFNGKPSITFNNNNNVYTMAAGGIGIGAPPVAMTNSFTIMAGIRPSSATAQSLYGDNAGTTGSSSATGFYLGTSGTLNYQLGSSSFTSLGVLLAPATTGAIWISFDAAASVLRAGVNNGNTLLQTSTTFTRNGASGATVCLPFALSPSGSSGDMAFNRWTIWNKAFMNGAVPSDDAAFSNLVASYAAFI